MQKHHQMAYYKYFSKLSHHLLWLSSRIPYCLRSVGLVNQYTALNRGTKVPYLCNRKMTEIWDNHTVVQEMSFTYIYIYNTKKCPLATLEQQQEHWNIKLWRNCNQEWLRILDEYTVKNIQYCTYVKYRDYWNVYWHVYIGHSIKTGKFNRVSAASWEQTVII